MELVIQILRDAVIQVKDAQAPGDDRPENRSLGIFVPLNS